MATEKLSVILELISGNYKREAKEAAAATGQIGTAAATSTKGMGGLGTAMGALKGALLAGGVAAAGAAIVKLGREAVNAASDLNESINAVGVVFEESQARILEWGETAAETAGLSRNAFHESVIPIGALLKNFGFDVDASADAVIALTQRAADLGSTLNIDTSVALDKFRAGLAGEAEPLKAFGVDVSVAAIQAEALALGLIKSGDALDSNTRAQAALSIIMKSTDDFAGDFANTLGTSLPNQAKKLTAQIDNLKARLGQQLLPAMLSVTKAFGDMTEEGGFLETVLTGLAGELGDTADQAAGVFGILDKITKQLADTAGATDEATEAASRYNSLWDILIPGLGVAGGQLQDLNEFLDMTKTLMKDTGSVAQFMAFATKDDLVPAVTAAIEPIDRLSTAQRLAGDATRHHHAELVGLATFLAAQINPVLGAHSALERLSEAHDAVADAAEEHGRKSEEFALAQVELALATAEAQVALGEFGTNSPESIAAVATALGISNDAALALLETLGLLDGTTVTTTIINRQINLLEEGVIPEGQGWTASQGTSSTTFTPKGSFASGGVVPGPLGMPQLIIAHGGETITPAAQSTMNSSKVVNFTFLPAPNRAADLQFLSLMSNLETLVS